MIYQDLRDLEEDFKTIIQKHQKTLEHIQNLVNKPVLKIQEIQDLNKLLQKKYSHEHFRKFNFFNNNHSRFIEAKEISLKEKVEQQEVIIL
jgi:Txe/YoeB family toxin of Txe-Axe toxin-antitoxin module